MDREESKWGRDKTMFAPTLFGYNLEKKKKNVYHEKKNVL
jgi:hypothetical protein